MRKKVDSNQNQIRQYLHQIGFLTASTSDTGNGCPDLLVSGYDVNQSRNRLTWWEIKTDVGKLQENQKEFHEKWDRHDVFVARSVDGILEEYGIL